MKIVGRGIVMGYDFFAMMSRMKLIGRWSLMRNSRQENISEHSLEVSMLAHALAVISRERLNKPINVERAALMGIYHDATEIITGDMPTPIKYFNENIKGAYKAVEENAAEKLIRMLPQDMQKSYKEIFFPEEKDAYIWSLVKAADKLSALIKCIEERKAGNSEFKSAEESTYKMLIDMKLEEVNIFLKEFIPSYQKTLDELN